MAAIHRFVNSLLRSTHSYFLVQIELFFARPILRWRFPLLSEAFISGYLGGEGAARPAELELCRCAAALRALAALLRAGGGGEARVRRALCRQIVRETR